jgi:hypothetical protein
MPEMGSWPCENAKTLNRDRRSYSSKTAFVAQGASGLNFKLSYSITSQDRRLGHGSLFITSPRPASGPLRRRFQAAV